MVTIHLLPPPPPHITHKHHNTHTESITTTQQHYIALPHHKQHALTPHPPPTLYPPLRQINQNFFLMILSSRKKRWFVLNDNSILYYKSPKDVAPKGEIPVSTCFVRLTANQEVCTGIPGYSSHCFEVSIPRGRTYTLCAPSEEDRKTWMRQIKVQKSAWWKANPNASPTIASPTPSPRGSNISNNTHNSTNKDTFVSSFPFIQLTASNKDSPTSASNVDDGGVGEDKKGNGGNLAVPNEGDGENSGWRGSGVLRLIKGGSNTPADVDKKKWADKAMVTIPPPI